MAYPIKRIPTTDLTTQLISALSIGDRLLRLRSNRFPADIGVVVIGEGASAEAVLVDAMIGDDIRTISGVTKAHPAGEVVARIFTVEDYNAIVGAILDSQDKRQKEVLVVSASTTIVPDDHTEDLVVLADTTAANIIITLSNPIFKSPTIYLKKTDASVHTATITPGVDGADYILELVGEFVQIVWTGAAWAVIGE